MSIDTIDERFVAVGTKILLEARSELTFHLRYLDLALSALTPQITTELSGLGTDGEYMIAHPKILADWYERDRRMIDRIYLHCTMHCLFRHLFKKPGEDEQLWRIACDIAVESIIDELRARPIRMGVSRLRRNWYDLLHAKLKVLTAEGIYRVLVARGVSPFEKNALLAEFCIDDHSLWPVPKGNQPSPPPMEMLQNKWQDISEKTQTRQESFARDRASGDGDLLDTLKTENRERYDYKAFLRRFAALREEVQVDPDSFDYVFYTYGLMHYGNLPLIEPQESREVRRIEEFAIIIDVSMSTSGDLVKTFLEQTYSVLTEKESYLQKVNIHIILCDEKIRGDVKITSREQLDDYMAHFQLEGGGGTDFRPAFAYVDELMQRGEFQDLRGLIYFTDGYGTYPRMAPPYETAFVFMQEDYTDVDVPPWAIKLIIEQEQLEEEQKGLRTDYRFIDGEES